MLEFFFTSPWWSWYMLGLLLLALELFAPGAFFIWIGVGAVAIGLITHVTGPFAWEGQMVIFAILSGLSVFLGRRIVRSDMREDRNTLNRRLAGHVGRTARLEQAVEHGEGRIRLDDTLWRVKGKDMPVGTNVRVTGFEGTVLLVEKEEPGA